MRKRSLVRFAAWGCAFALGACDPTEDDAVDAGEDAASDASTPAGRGGPSGSAGTGTAGGGGRTMEPPPDGGNSDAGSDSFLLDGEWEDNGRRLRIVVDDDGAVGGSYIEDVFCDLESGSVPAGTEPEPGANVESTLFDFYGALDHAGPEVMPGDIISSDASGDSGGLNTCRYGFEADSGVENGFVLAPFWLEVIDRDTLRGEWEPDEDADGTPEEPRPFEVTRL